VEDKPKADDDMADEAAAGPRIAGCDGSVVVLPPIPPEKQAYALARYSRSPDSISESLKWVHAHSAERFWEKFYFEYGHASIADLGHLAICLEGVSELAAAEVLHEALIDAQQKSTRYQDFGAVPLVWPGADGEAKQAFERASADLMTAYRKVYASEHKALQGLHPRPADMDEDRYDRTLAARAFDVARYLLPMGTTTNLGTVMSVRTLERTIGRLLVSPYAEVRALAARLAEACSQPPDGTWAGLMAHSGPAEPLAPTLARHAHPQEYAAGVRERAKAAFGKLIGSACGGGATGGWRESAGAAGAADLVPAHGLTEEILATLLYRDSRHSYRVILGAVAELPAEKRDSLLGEILGAIGKHDEPARELRAGQAFVFDIAMDWGGWRDMHRHRRCEQVVQALDLDAGLRLPPETADPATPDAITAAYEAAVGAARELAAVDAQAAHYLLPFAHQVRCLFKMDFSEVQYITRLRSGPKGHDSYRAIAWAMAEAARKVQPALASYIAATPPEVREPLIR
jgi:thymidylate synthase ThyX